MIHHRRTPRKSHPTTWQYPAHTRPHSDRETRRRPALRALVGGRGSGDADLSTRNHGRAGLQKACEKRTVSRDKIDEFTDNIEHKLQDYGAKEIPSEVVGEWVMEGLPLLDEVAYVRFASVYRQFKDVNEFMDELKTLLDSRGLDEGKSG